MTLLLKNVDKELLSLLNKYKNTENSALQIISEDSSIPHSLSLEDEAHLKETLNLYKKGKLKSYSIKESIAISEKHLRQLGANL